MITIIVLFQFCQHFITHYLHFFRQQIQIIAHLLLYFFFRNAADGSIRFIHTDVLDIIQFTEDAQLGKLRDSGQKHIAQIRVTGFQRTVEVTHHIAKYGQILILMHYIKKRSIIFVNQDNNLLAGLLKSALYHPLQALVNFNITFTSPIYFFIFQKFSFQFTVQPFFIHVLRCTHVKVKNRMHIPFRLQLFDSKSFEQFFPPLKITMKRTGQQRLAKTTRTTQKHIFGSRMRHAINVFSLVNIQIILSYDF